MGHALAIPCDLAILHTPLTLIHDYQSRNYLNQTIYRERDRGEGEGDGGREREISWEVTHTEGLEVGYTIHIWNLDLRQ